jgi:CheY-like chemotaxis protein
MSEGNRGSGDSQTSSRQLKFRLLGDQPHVAQKDPLGFDQMASDLTHLIVSSAGSTPFTLGIEASWGAGKSSLMRRIEEQVTRDPTVSTVWFNAWTAQEGEVLEGLIKSVLDQMDPNVLRRALRSKRVGKGLRIAGRAVAGLLRMDKVVDEIWEKVSADPRARNEMRELMQEAMVDWRGKDGGVRAGRLLVVFVDDLDRCSPENVFQVFEAMKLYLDAPGFVFVVGYDRGVISDAILHEKKYGEAVKSQDYIEKIVQIVHRIGPPDYDQAQALLDSYAGASLTTDHFRDSARPVVIERNARNPRRIKRFINGFILEYGLDPEWESFGAVTLIHVLILYMYFPDFARLMNDRTNREPIGEFLEYRDVREMLRQLPREADPNVRPADEKLVEKVFADHRLPVHYPMNSGALDALEEELPEAYPALAQNEDFVEVLRSLGDPEGRRRLVDKLQRRRPHTPSGGPDPRSEGTAVATDRPPISVRILWLNDEPESDLELIDSITARGATVSRARNLEEAIALLRSAPRVDVLVSDLTREGNPNAGFEELERLRSEASYGGEVIFYTLRVTPSRRKRADELGARMTNDPNELHALLDAFADQAPTSKVAPVTAGAPA